MPRPKKAPEDRFVRVNITMDPKIHASAMQMARSRRWGLSTLIASLIEAELAKIDKVTERREDEE